MVTPQGVTQASDRLVSAGGKPLDPLANKSVVYCARNAVVAIAYTGLASLEGIRTDDWIAFKLRGEEPERFAVSNTVAPQWLDIGQAVELLRSETERVFSTGQESKNLRYPHILTISGLQWEKRHRDGQHRVRLFASEIVKPASSAAVRIETLVSRHENYPFALHHIPPRQELAGDVEALSEALQKALPDFRACESILADAIRLVSERSGGLEVGPHVMTISIPMPHGGPIAGLACFRPHSAAGVADARYPAAYMPAFVLGPRIFVRSSVIQGSYGPMTFSGGGAQFVSEALPIPLQPGADPRDPVFRWSSDPGGDH
jgi:hypothetical protein